MKRDKNELSLTPSNLRNNETTAEFEVANLSTIPSDNNPYNVSVADFTLPATYTYQSVPKLDKAVFLSAGITGWEAYSLQDGMIYLLTLWLQSITSVRRQK